MVAGAALVVLLSAGFVWTNRAAARRQRPLFLPRGKRRGIF